MGTEHDRNRIDIYHMNKIQSSFIFCSNFSNKKPSRCHWELIHKTPNNYCTRSTNIVAKGTVPVIEVDLKGKYSYDYLLC